MKNLTNIIPIGLLFALQSCVGVDSDTPLYIYNKSHFTIAAYIPLVGMDGGIYPDTTLSFKREQVGYPTEPAKIMYTSISNIRVEHWVLSFPKDTVSIFIFNQDVLNNCPWEEIQRDYKILQRYDLSVENIQGLKNDREIPTIDYPPTEAMKNIKMYPPYP